MAATCAHGAIQRDKYGTENRNGLDVCLGCGLPTWESLQAASASDPPYKSPTLADRAREARARGDRFFELQLEVSTSSRQVAFGEKDSGSLTSRDNTRALAEVEAEGWRLEHVGYSFVATGASTRSKILGTGEYVATSGVTIGVYLFRAIAIGSNSIRAAE